MITCFLITATNRAYRFLRRLTLGDGIVCPLSPHGYGHSADAEIEPGPLVLDADGHVIILEWPRDDPRWPQQCACGYVFQASDYWQCNQWTIYAGPDGQEYSIHHSQLGTAKAAPPGSMWEAPWLADFWHGDDGRCYVLRLPPDNHDWTIDGPATSGGGWTRTGEPPRITARPSILTPHYHGWLTDGVLSPDLEGRTYD